MTAACAALGVEADLARGQHAPLDRVDLRDDVAVARERDVLALEQDLKVRRPALLRVVREGLANDPREVAGQALGEVHADAAPVGRQARDGQRAQYAAHSGWDKIPEMPPSVAALSRTQSGVR